MNSQFLSCPLAGLQAIVYPPALFYHYGSGTQNGGDESGKPIVSGNMFEASRTNFTKKWGGVPGEETWKNPYNDKSKSLRSTKQDPRA